MSNELVKQAKKILTSFFHELEFFEDTHTYLVNGEKYDSVTTIVHQLAQPFEKEANAEKYAKKHGLTKEDVIAKWDLNSKQASEYGTAVHLYIENKWNGVAIRETLTHSQEKYLTACDKYDRFHLDLCKKYLPVVNEFRIYDKDYHVAGTLDALFFNKESNSFELFDWKTSKEINQENKWAKMKKFWWFDDCNYNHYSFQMGVYRYILEKYTNLNISDMNIVQVSENYPEAIIYKLPYKKAEVTRLLKERK